MRLVGFALIVAFWLLYFGFLSIARAIQYPEAEKDSMMLPRTLTGFSAVAISAAIMEVHIRVRTNSVALRLILTLLLAAVGCVVHFTANYSFFWWLGPEMKTGANSMVLSDYAIAIVDWLFIYFGISAGLMALRFHADVIERDLNLARLDALARDAELRALRYQLNPHFLFNALNSAAALISQGKAPEAEGMVENLSDFLRAGLALDADDDIPLAQEMALQKLYLDVEAVRFPNRLHVVFDVPDELADALVPSLLLQPLVENAIKYSVAQSTAPVTLTLRAGRSGERLRLVVADDGGDGEQGGGEHGTGVGLANVAARLQVRFGDDHMFIAGADPNGGFRVTLELPLRTA